MPIRWFRTRGEGCGGAGSPVCGVRGGAPPDFTEIGARGSIRGAAWPGRTIATSVIYWNRLCGVAADGARRVAEEAALRGGRAPVNDVPTVLVGYGLLNLAQQG